MSTMDFENLGRMSELAEPPPQQEAAHAGAAALHANTPTRTNLQNGGSTLSRSIPLVESGIEMRVFSEAPGVMG
jgi:hypothetical protein